MTIAALRRVDIDAPDSDGAGRRTLFSTASLALQGLVRLALSIAVGRLAGPDALAQVTAGLAAASILSLLWPSATGAAASRFIAAGQAREDPIALRRITGHLGLRTLQASCVLAPAGFLYWWFTHGHFGESLTIAALTLGLGGYAYARGVHTGSRQIRRLIVWDLAASVLGVFGTVLMVWNGVHSAMALAPLAVGYLMITAASWPPSAPGKPAEAGDMDHFILWSTVGTLTSAGLIHMAMLVAYGRLSAADAGAFAAALNLVSPAALLANSFSMVLFPNIAAAFARDDQESALRQTRLATDGLVAAMLLIFGTLSLLTPWIVNMLWGPSFGLAALVFPLLSLGPLARAVSMPAVTSLSSRERAGVRHAALSTLAGLGVALVTWALADNSGWWGVALGYSAAMSVTGFRNVLRAWQVDHHPWAITWVKLALGLACFGAAIATREQLDLGLLPTLLLLLLLSLGWCLLNLSTLRTLITRSR